MIAVETKNPRMGIEIKAISDLNIQLLTWLTDVR